MRAILLFLLALLLAGCSSETAQPLPHSIGSFQEGKKLAMNIYEDNRTTFYCGCKFDAQKNIDAKDCGYTPRKDASRGQRVEWEHVVPAYAFGHTRQCWRDPDQFPACRKENGKSLPGRSCCRKVDRLYNAMAGDLYNLVPAVGELNNDRGNFNFGEIEGEVRNYGACDFEVDNKAQLAEPAAALRGDIARTYFYFEKTYGLAINSQQRLQFTQWSQQDPVDDWERTRAERIRRIQGNAQPFIMSGDAVTQ